MANEADIPAYTDEDVRATVTVGDATEWYNAATSVGSAVGDVELASGLNIARIRVDASGTRFRFNRGASDTVEMSTYFGVGESGRSKYIHVATDGGNVAIEIDGTLTNLISTLVRFDPITADAAILNAVAVGESIGLVIASNTRAVTSVGYGRLGVQLDVDLDGDGAFGGTGEDLTGDMLLDTGIVVYRGYETERDIIELRMGTLFTEVNNRAGAYSSGSDLTAGKLTRLQLVGRDAWTGFLQRPTQNFERDRPSVAFSALGRFSRLQGAVVSTPLMQNTTIGDAMEAVLLAAGLDASEIDVGGGTLPLLWFWADNQDAFSLCRELHRTEGPGSLFTESAAGVITFRSRQQLATDMRSTNVQYLIEDLGAGLRIGRELRVYAGAEAVINAPTITINERSLKALTPVWSQSTPDRIGANQTAEIIARSSEPFTGAAVPVEGTDFTVTSGSITAVALSRTSGQSTTIRLTAGAVDAMLDGLQLRARPVTVDAQTEISSAADVSGSVALHGQRGRPDGYTLYPELTPSIGRNLMDAIITWYGDGKERAAVQIQGPRLPAGGAADPSLDGQTGIDLGWRFGIEGEGEYYTTGIRHLVRSGVILESTLWGDAIVGSVTQFATWDTARWGTSTWGF